VLPPSDLPDSYPYLPSVEGLSFSPQMLLSDDILPGLPGSDLAMLLHNLSGIPALFGPEIAELGLGPLLAALEPALSAFLFL
jgi:hypothetical protein